MMLTLCFACCCCYCSVCVRAPTTTNPQEGPTSIVDEVLKGRKRKKKLSDDQIDADVAQLLSQVRVRHRVQCSWVWMHGTQAQRHTRRSVRGAHSSSWEECTLCGSCLLALLSCHCV